MLSSGYNGGKVIIAHCENEEAAKVMKSKIVDEFADAKVSIMENRALCSFYAEVGGLLVSFEGKVK